MFFWSGISSFKYSCVLFKWTGKSNKNLFLFHLHLAAKVYIVCVCYCFELLLIVYWNIVIRCILFMERIGTNCFTCSLINFSIPKLPSGAINGSFFSKSETGVGIGERWGKTQKKRERMEGWKRCSNFEVSGLQFLPWIRLCLGNNLPRFLLHRLTQRWVGNSSLQSSSYYSSPPRINEIWDSFPSNPGFHLITRPGRMKEWTENTISIQMCVCFNLMRWPVYSFLSYPKMLYVLPLSLFLSY